MRFRPPKRLSATKIDQSGKLVTCQEVQEHPAHATLGETNNLLGICDR